MKIKVKRENTFIPEWHGNKKDENPIEVDIKYLTTGELDDCITESGTIDRKKICKIAVKAIRNLETEDGRKITTFDEMMGEPGLSLLYSEIFGEIARVDPIENSKN